MCYQKKINLENAYTKFKNIKNEIINNNFGENNIKYKQKSIRHKAIKDISVPNIIQTENELKKPDEDVKKNLEDLNDTLSKCKENLKSFFGINNYQFKVNKNIIKATRKDKILKIKIYNKKLVKKNESIVLDIQNKKCYKIWKKFNKKIKIKLEIKIENQIYNILELTENPDLIKNLNDFIIFEKKDYIYLYIDEKNNIKIFPDKLDVRINNTDYQISKIEI